MTDPERYLSPSHQTLIDASAISSEVAAQRGYCSVTTKAQLTRLGFAAYQARPGLLIPVYNVLGEVVLYQLRSDEPRIKDGKPLKYETPAKAQMVVDVPPIVRRSIGNPSIPLFATEGIRKGDAAASAGLCCVDLLGVWSFRGNNAHGGLTTLADFDAIAFNERKIYIAFDSDVMEKPQVHSALSRLKGIAEQRHATVLIIYLPPGPAGQKQGLDDYLAAGHSVADLFALATPNLRRVDAPTASTPYRMTDNGIVWTRTTRDGDVETALTNFAATITADVTEDDGSGEVRRQFVISARQGQRLHTFQVPAAQFPSLNWAVENLGSSAVVSPGMGVRDHARAAIQMLSPDARQERVYTHTGWIDRDGEWLYLHAGGAIGPIGPVGDVSVRLQKPLDRYLLPDPPVGNDLGDAVRASLKMLSVTAAVVSVQIFATTFRPPLGQIDASTYLVGSSGVGKTELAALAQQHYGAGMDRTHLPGAWSSTANANEGASFAAKDALYVVDDFAPGGSSSDVQRFHRDADRLLRAQGNSTGRRRMRPDGSLAPSKDPRGMILSTGEDIPRGASLRARTFIVEVAANGAGSLNWAVLSECQRDAADGKYAMAMAGYLQWLAPRYEELQRTLRSRIARLREYARNGSGHRRTPELVANLGLGLQAFLCFAVDSGAIMPDEADSLWARGWRALGEAASRQSVFQRDSDPAQRFVELLASALSSGRAHLAEPVNGHAPPDADRWGWRQMGIGSGDNYREEWRPMGERIGWVDAEGILLDPDASYAVAQRLAGDQGESVVVSPKTLHKRMHERGLLASVDDIRHRLTVRKTVLGERRYVLHLHIGVFKAEEPAQSAQPAQSLETSPFSDSTSEGCGPVSWAGFLEPSAESAHRIGPFPKRCEPAPMGSGPVGPVGPVLSTGNPLDVVEVLI